MSQCHYHSENDFIANVQSIHEHSFSMIHTNMWSSNKNLTQLKKYLQSLQYTFDIIALTETWLKKYNIDTFGIDGYNQFHCSWEVISFILKMNCCLVYKEE